MDQDDVLTYIFSVICLVISLTNPTDYSDSFSEGFPGKEIACIYAV